MAVTTENGQATKKPSLGLLDKLIGDEGAKFDVRVVLADDFFFKLVIAFIVAFAICLALHAMVRAITK
jgi:hypothetical protein